MRLLVTAFAFILAGASSAYAQGDVVVRFEGARANSAYSTTPTFGGVVAVRVSEIAEAFGEFAQEFGHEYGPDTATASPGSGSLPVTIIFVDIVEERIDRYALGGIRLHLPNETAFRPFAELGAGVARMRSSDTDGLRVFRSTLSYGVLTVGGGLDVRLSRRISVGVGYRYNHPAGEFSGRGFHTVHSGIGVVF